MADEFLGEKFTFGSFNEAQAVRDNADLLIDKDGYITVRDLLKLIFHGHDAVWVGMEDFLDYWGWTDTLCWKVKQPGYFWVLDTPQPKKLFKYERKDND